MTRKILVVGGTGMIGSHIAARLRDEGDDVTIAARNVNAQTIIPAISGIPQISLDYTDLSLKPSHLAGFDAVVFSSGQDIRHVDLADETPEYWRTVQSEGVPRFAALARDAGVESFVQIGSYYHQLHPEWSEHNPYVAARKSADEKSRALTRTGFRAMTLNPPSIVGVIPGRSLRIFSRLVAWVKGEPRQPPLIAPPGGTNYMSVTSLAQAVFGALNRGVGGTAYLLGDESLSYRDYFQKVASVAGSDLTVLEQDQECPFLPDRFIVQGRGHAIAFEPNPDDVSLLGYTRNDVEHELRNIVAAVNQLQR